MRYFAEVSYHGQNYSGWQIQPNANTVQAEIQNALSTLLTQPLEIVGSGRTDAGVHARQQYFHVDLPDIDSPMDFCYKLNAILPEDIAIIQILPVQSESHARFDAVSRSYEYHINTQKNPFIREVSYFYSQPLDLALMNEACTYILKYDDFQSFSKVKTQVNNFNCQIMEASWNVHNERLVFYVSANRFLRGMVRAIVGTLIEIGSGKFEPDRIHQIVQGKDRRLAGAAAPAHGLTLTRVEYPSSIFK